MVHHSNRTTKASLVLTTINDPVVLEHYHANFSKYGHLDEVRVFLIPDKKTAAGAFTRCRDLAGRGLDLVCPGFGEQEEFLARVGFPPHLVPYNSDNRRNIGFLMALEDGCGFVISVDDDNYPREGEDFFAGHATVMEGPREAEVVNTESGWFNICGLLELDRPGEAYPRGFPYFARHAAAEVRRERSLADVHINAGLWLGEPDVDAISWLAAPARAISMKGSPVVLGNRAWSPVNTQNTSLKRECLAAYYYLKMGYPLGGMPIDRYGDIFSGYFAQACARHLGGAVRAGTPLADHIRNSHDYMKDASNEWACIAACEDILAWLPEARLSGGTYDEAYVSLSHELQEAVERFRGRIWTDAARGYFHQAAFYMRKWAAACRRLA